MIDAEDLNQPAICGRENEERDNAISKMIEKNVTAIPVVGVRAGPRERGGDRV